MLVGDPKPSRLVAKILTVAERAKMASTRSAAVSRSGAAAQQ
jgi:hypothetical protein